MKKIIIFILGAFALILAAWGFAWPWHVSGDCMEPAIKDGKTYFLNRMLPYLRQYKANDIIVFKYENKIWISRIVGLENDTIQITDGKIIINNATLNDSIERNWADWNYGAYAINEPFKIPSNHVYVLSDNLTAHHDDSRVFGPIPKETILGIVW